MAEQDKAGWFVAYRNKNTGAVHVTDGPAADLDARPNFERVPLGEVPPHVLDEVRREHAARESIEASADIRRLRVEVTGEDAARAAGAAATSTAGAVVQGSYDAPSRRMGAGDPAGVLSRPGVDDVQIGPRPEQHPKGHAALEAQARLDSEHPSNIGVLARQHADGDRVSRQVPEAAREAGAEVAETVPNADPADTGDADTTAQENGAGPDADQADTTAAESGTADDKAGDKPTKPTSRRKATGSK